MLDHGKDAANLARSAAERYVSMGSTGSMMWVSASKMRYPPRAMGSSRFPLMLGLVRCV